MSEEKLNRPDPEYADVRASIVELLKVARAASARSVNAVMIATYWEIERRIVESEMRGEKRAELRRAAVERLAVDLSKQFGRGFGKISLWRMRAFFQAWPNKQILSTPLKQSAPSMPLSTPDASFGSLPTLSASFPLPWSAYLRLLSVRNQEARKFYKAEATRAGWSVRQLDRQIGGQFYERIALSKNKAGMLERAEVPNLSRLKRRSKIFSCWSSSISKTNTQSQSSKRLSSSISRTFSWNLVMISLSLGVSAVCV